MSAHNFWDNFTHGFMHGMFNNNPFFGGCMSNFNFFQPFNSCFSARFTPTFTPSLFTSTPFPNNLYMYPNVMSQSNYYPYMQDSQPPSLWNMAIDLNEIFPNEKWQTNTNNSTMDFNFRLNNKQTLSDTFERSLSETSTDKSTTRTLAKMTNKSINDKYFDKMLKQILSYEGGYVNDPNDSGGKTNKGVTQKTYDGYRRQKGLPLRSVREITDAEIKDIYYKFFTESGADKIDNPRMALMVFDTAVGSGTSKAKELFRKSGGDINKYAQLRKEWYADIVRRRPKNKKYINGWNNRVTNTIQFANANLPDKLNA